MKVLMIGWEFPPHNSGGLGVACQGLANALLGQNVDLLFVLPKRFELEKDNNLDVIFADATNFKKQQVTVKQIETPLSPYVTSREYEAYRRTLSNDIYGDTLFEEVERYARAISEIAEEENFDVIHAHDWLSYLAAAEAKRVSGKPLILHVHATAHDFSGGNPDPRIFIIEKEVMKLADTVITVSQFTKDILTCHYGVSPSKIKVVHNGIISDNYKETDSEDGNKFHIPIKKAGQKIVLFVGRITLMKGPDYFLKAAKRVLEHEPNTLFVIAGSGDMEWQIIRQAANLGISDKVLFAGFVRGEELNSLYKAADLYVLPSVSEPFGLTPLESIINGTPVLISKQSGISEVLSGALKVDFWDVEEMANKIICTLRYPKLGKAVYKEGSKEANSVTWEKAAKKCIEIYKKLA